MTLGLLKQTAQSILDGIRACRELENDTSLEAKKKREDLSSYLVKLCYTLQKGIDDERSSL